MTNTGDRNTGDRNTGYRNTGHRNTGHRNTGHRNIGDLNTGDRNIANYCVWCFNTEQPKMRLFNKEIDMTPEEFYEEYRLYVDIKLTERIVEGDMTDKEKKENPTYETTWWYLKKREHKEACKLRWREAKEEERKKFLSLPWFDAKIFKEITGIDVDQRQEEMTLEEVCKELGRDIKIVI